MLFLALFATCIAIYPVHFVHELPPNSTFFPVRTFRFPANVDTGFSFENMMKYPWNFTFPIAFWTSGLYVNVVPEVDGDYNTRVFHPPLVSNATITLPISWWGAGFDLQLAFIPIS